MSETHDPTTFLDPQGLLEHSGWVRALARRLVNDENLADDLVQDTWVEALARRPEGNRPLRGWLATVMRHNLAKLRRGDRHRSAREEDSSRNEREPSTLDVVERANTHRDVVLEVMALEEPYRSTLLLRFFDQLSYAEIATELGITKASVNSRVTRGLDRLRQRLERKYGDRRALALALAPLAGLPSGPAPFPFPESLPMQVTLVSSALTLAALTATAVWPSNEPAMASPSNLALAPALPEPAVRAAGPVLLTPTLLPEVREESVPLAFQEDRRVEKRVEQEERQKAEWTTDLYQAVTVSEAMTAVQLSASSGDLELRPARGGSIEIEAKVTADLEVADERHLTQLFEDHIKVVEEKGVLKIEEKKKRRGLSTSFVLYVPDDLAATLNTGSGDLLIRRAGGKVRGNTGSGDVLVELSDADLSSMQVNTGSGDIELDVRSVGTQLLANTGSGDVSARVRDFASPGKLNLNTGSGDAHLVLPPNFAGKIALKTHGDGIEVPAELGMVVETLDDGRLEAKATFGEGGSYSVNTGSGDVKFELMSAGTPTKAR